ncbi:multicopper oxidase [Pleomassaria siparia CBS 279.74]|uniref:Multicopper oxidase n=1 Tax=Pleomassaria siparia CBS 279.74 TaxID=1314801 RepID=A0A6G1KJP2_9PLEO|nr:multicopper oxidase [Pleomassaria siparia CBS 279.74]
MVAYASYVAGTASLSSLYQASSPSVCQIATITVYETADAVTTTIAASATNYPIVNSAADPNDHGGPYDNPYNNVPLPYDFPGQPSHGQVYPPPKPSPPFNYGGPAAGGYDAPAWIPKGSHKLVPSLPKGVQNGNSTWGDINCPHLPISGLPGAPQQTASPSNAPYPPYPTNGFGNSTAGYTTGIYSTGLYSTRVVTAPTAGSSSNAFNPAPSSTGAPAQDCPTMPDTGVTRTYDMHVAYQTIAPDGVMRNGITVNGQFPGPLVEANWGDWILFKVTNDLTNEGTTLHAHGMLQSNTSWYDGVPAVSQCPITPNGGTLEMLFRAEQYGTSWYHSHYSAQYSGGAHGPLVVYGPKHAEYDIDIGPVLLEDWFHADYFTLVNDTMNGRFPPSNNNLINGKMQYPCANTTLPCQENAGISKFQFQSGKKHLLRLVNTGAEGLQKFSIDGHKLTVIALDFTPIEPYETNVVTLGIGQRSDVIVEGTGAPSDAFWMRSQLGTQNCTLNDGISPNAVAAVYYQDADTSSVPNTTSDVTDDQLAACKNDALTLGVPLCQIAIEEPETIEEVTFDFRSNGTNFVWFVNNSTYRGDFNQPTLLQANKGDFNFEEGWNVMNFGSNSSVRIHLINNGIIGAHPMHLHGHDFHVLAEGTGTWDGTVTNPSNTVRRDVQMLQNGQDTSSGVIPSYMVLQYNQNNPGMWPLHCHLAWHLSGGLFFQVLERPDDLMKEVVANDVTEVCNAWDTYTKTNVPDQIDSGL